MFELYAYDKTRKFYPTVRYMFYTINQAKTLYCEQYGLKYRRLSFTVQAIR